VQDYDVSSFEGDCFEKDCYPVNVLACDFVFCVESCAYFQYAYLAFFDFFAEALQVVLVCYVQVYSVCDFFGFGDFCFFVCFYLVVYPV